MRNTVHWLMKLANSSLTVIAHKGYALVDILQLCTTFKKVNTYAYYKECVYELEGSYDPTNKLVALEKSMEDGDKIPIGILYSKKCESYEQKRPALFGGAPVIDKALEHNQVNALIEEFI